MQFNMLLLYHIMSKIAMGAGDKSSQNENMGAKTAAGSTRLYHIMAENAIE